MDPSDTQQLASLASLFQQTLNPEQRKAAEEQISQLQVQPYFVYLLLSLIQSESASTAVRLAAAIQFKNICKLRWVVDDESEEDVPNSVSDEEKYGIRQQLVPVLVSLASAPSPSQAILSQLNESIALVASYDFPDAWPSLIDELVSQLSTDNHHILLSVLSTSHAIFKRWRSQFRSDALYMEINLVLGKMANPLLELLQRMHSLLMDPSTPSSTMQPLAMCLMLLLQLFYDLSAQDLPPQFEDAIPTLSPMFTSLLSYSRPELIGDEDDVAPSPLVKIRSSVCEIFELYAKRYLDVLPQLPDYVQAVWDMLGTYGPAEKYDVIVSKAIGFLSTVVRMGNQRELFQADSTLEQFCTAIILPNIQLRDIDEEIFEDNPMEYIRRDLEQSIEIDTRRRAACEFVRALLEQFSTQITAICSRHIQAYLAEFQANPMVNWRRKDAAIYLLTSIAAQSSTMQHGVSSTNALVDVVQFFSNHVLQDLQPDNDTAKAQPILQVDAIKYLYTFRNQLTKDQLLSVLPLLVHHLSSTNYVTCTYAAISIERILFIRVNGHRLLNSTDIEPFTRNMLEALFAAVEQHETPEKVAENDHVMKCVMRVLLVAKKSVEPYAGQLLEHLVSIIQVTSRNPSNPRFTQFLFESVSTLLRFMGSSSTAQVAMMEERLFPVCTEILQADVAEYIPYVFQILAQLLEAHANLDSVRQLPEAYASLLPPLLMPALWEKKSHVPALVRLMKAYLKQSPAHLVHKGHVESCLGIYQKLISSRLNDAYGFDLLRSMIIHLPPEPLAPYMQPVITLMLVRLQSSKTDRFSQQFVLFIGFLCGLQRQGYPEAVVQLFDSVQSGLFGQIAENVIAPDLSKLTAKLRFNTAAGIIRLLTQSYSMLSTYANAWPALAISVMHLLLQTGPPTHEITEDDGADLDEQGFQASYSQLASAGSATDEVGAESWAGPDLWAYFARQLGEARTLRSESLAPLLQQVPNEVLMKLNEALQREHVTIS